MTTKPTRYRVSARKVFSLSIYIAADLDVKAEGINRRDRGDTGPIDIGSISLSDMNDEELDGFLRTVSEWVKLNMPRKAATKKAVKQIENVVAQAEAKR